MLQLKTKQKLSTEAVNLARSFNLVRYRNITYIPADYETLETSVPPEPDRTVWLPLTRDRIQELAAVQYETLFGSDGELAAFDFMVAQASMLVRADIHTLLVRTSDGLKQLDDDGQLIPVTGDFRPNTLEPVLNTDTATKEQVFNVVAEWLNSEEEAKALLSHLATALAPGWSAVKYILLLGEGRNGKSLLLKMLQEVFGRDNTSNVTRQAIATQSPVVCELNGKLLNLVFDGQAEYLKDSGAEKTLIAGEPYPIRRLYESSPTKVQTNALFIEGLQREPKTSDKSSALQKRLVRFQFPNVYPFDRKFEKTMLSEEMLGAFLAVLIDHYVREDEVAERLALTSKAMELQLEQMFANSLGMQFIKYVEETDPLGATSMLGVPLQDLTKLFQSWRLKENDLGTWSDPDVQAQLLPFLNTERRGVRIDGKPRKIRVVTSFKAEATAFLESLKEVDADEALINALVED